MQILEEYPDLLDEEFVETYDFGGCYTRTSSDGVIGELDTAVAILRTRGVPADMKRLLGKGRATIGRYIDSKPALKELLEDVAEDFLDEVEKLHKNAALQGDLTAQRFILQTLGKRRGYTTRQEVDMKAKTEVIIEAADAAL